MNEIDKKLVGNEQKLVFTIQKFPHVVGVRAEQKVVNAREKKVTPFRYCLNVCQHFTNSFDIASGLLKFARGSRCDPQVSGSLLEMSGLRFFPL